MILGLLDEAVRDGARLKPACETIGLSVRTIQRKRLVLAPKLALAQTRRRL